MKKIILIIGLLAIIGAGVGYWMYNKPHQNMQRAKVDATMTSSELYSAFDEDENAANTQYLDKILQISGTVAEVSTDSDGQVSITLDAGDMAFGGVICKLDPLSDHKRTDFKAGEEVSFKGVCTGFLMDVIVVRCVEM